METAVMTPEYLLKIAKDTIEAVEYCFLITRSELGQANARLVQHLKPEAAIEWLHLPKIHNVSAISDRCVKHDES